MQRLALRNPDTQLLIAKHGAVQPLITLIDSAGANRSQEYAAAALAQLGLVRAGKSAILRGGGIVPLVGLLCDRHRQPDAKQHAAAALALLSQESARGQRSEEELPSSSESSTSSVMPNMIDRTYCLTHEHTHAYSHAYA